MARRNSSLLCLSGLLVTSMFLPTALYAQERGMSRQDVLEALENGVVALRTIDRPDQAKQLLETLREYANLVKDRPDRARKEGGDAQRENLIPERYREMTEEEIAKRTILVMRYGLEGLKDADREKAFELMEHAIHARELRLERARGEEAAKIMETAPNRANEIELLLFAAKLLDEQGKGEKAMVVKELGDWFHATWRRNRQREQDRKRVGKREGAQDRDRESSNEREQERNRKRKRDLERDSQSMERVVQEINRHQELINELGQQLRRLSAANEKLRRQLNRLQEKDER